MFITTKVRVIALFIILGAITLLFWCWSYNKTTLSHWHHPILYPGNNLVEMATAKAYMDGELNLFGSKMLSRLNAPFIANWNDTPGTPDIVYAMTGWLARLTGLFSAINLFIASSCVLTSWSFFYVARKLQVSTLYGMAGALLVAFCPYVNHQMTSGDITLVAIWPIPLMLLSLYWFSTKQHLLEEKKELYFLIALALVVGTFNLYFSFLYCQLVGLTIISNLLTGYRKKALIASAVLLLIFLMYSILNFDTLVYATTHGWNKTLLKGSIGETEKNGLKLADLLAGGPILGVWAQGYFPQSMLQGVRGGYLGMVGIISLAWLIIESLYYILVRKFNQIGFYSAITFWIILYSIVGGFNHFFASLGFSVFPMTIKYSIWLQIIAMFFLLARLSQGSSRLKTMVIVLFMLLFGAGDHLAQHRSTSKRWFQMDQAFNQALEKSLPPGSLVFQLPVIPFPSHTNQPGINGGVPPFDHLRPYLFTSTLHYSFGTDKGRNQELWQQKITRLPVKQMLKQLQLYGFKGLYINRNGYPDFAHALITQIKQLGFHQILPLVKHSSIIAFNISPNFPVKPILPEIPQ